ncbi:WD40 repeat domain-containing protein [Bradyrhizobium sp. CCBAU 25360]|uniref:WD40 repeat domain-containing protein n=1 Tax=Bradyrhizobium sp. CCBAU 25360 TaxID=858425 RepID=UPI00230622D1|nr:WD40 repeat domain-containing protein [Bradyrhizobium sp. CCBAU 25360]
MSIKPAAAHEPDYWSEEFFETIFIIRDGLYQFRNDLRDKDNEEGTYSAEQLLSAMDRLYADLERAMRSLNPEVITNAQAEIAALMRTPYIDVRLIQQSVSELKDDVNELLTRTHITYQHFEVHLMRVHDAEVLRTAKLVVQRLSATAFAIKLSLEQDVVYQGIFRFLQQGADKIVGELSNLAEHFKRAYKDEREFTEDLSSLVDKGSKISRDIAKLLHQVFSDKPIEQKQLQLKTRNSSTGEPMVCATRLGDSKVVLGGKDGWIYVLDVQTGKVSDRHRIGHQTINCLARSSMVVVAGSQDGLETINPVTLVSLEYDSIYQENVSAVAIAPWGAVSGTRDGIARRWSLNEATLSKYGAENLKLGRSIQRMSLLGQEVVVAAGQNLFFIDHHFAADRKIPIDFTIVDMCPMDHTSLIVCGEGALAQVKLSAGKYTKYIAASESAKYTCVAGIDSKTFCAGNDDGVITVFDVESEAEIGAANVQFPLRGMIRVNNKLVVYGGGWRGKAQKTIAVLDWEEIIHRSKEFNPER